MLTLYDYGNSVCCQKVRITLREKGLDWDAIRVDLFASEQYDPKYLKLNPKGVVPTLVHDGVPVIESTLICEYLDETFPDPPLAPRDAAQRAQKSWRTHKAPMALYWKAVSVYARHIARAIPRGDA